MKLSICVFALAVVIPLANAWWFVPAPTTRAPTPRATSLVCKDCRCTCTNYGSKYQVRTPTKNGCGGSGFPSVNPYGFESCCNDHDICYGTAGQTIDRCDDNMDACMKRLCNARGWFDSAKCHLVRHTFNGVLDVGGCKFYRDAQKNNVGCR